MSELVNELVRGCPNCGEETLARGVFHPEAPAFGGDEFDGWLCIGGCWSFYDGTEYPEFR